MKKINIRNRYCLIQSGRHHVHKKHHCTESIKNTIVLNQQRAYFREITFSKGEKELVHVYKLWTLEEYTRVYEALGGHTGYCALLWRMIATYGHTMT